MEDKESYSGPIFVEYNIVSEFRDSTKLKIRVKAGEHRVLQNQNQEFSNGFYAESFDSQGNIASTLKSDSAKVFPKTQLWLFQGNVVLQNVNTKEKLLTEELYWDTKAEVIYNDKFVEVITPKFLLRGVGIRHGMNPKKGEKITEKQLKQVQGKIYLKDETN